MKYLSLIHLFIKLNTIKQLGIIVVEFFLSYQASFASEKNEKSFSLNINFVGNTNN